MPESRRIAYRSADGIERWLSDPSQGWYDARGRQSICRGVVGGGAIPPSFDEYTAPGVAGVRRRATVLGARDLSLAMTYWAPTPILLRELLRETISLLSADPPGELVAYSLAGTRRITAAYAGGLELDETRGNAGPTWLNAVIALRAHDPYFRGPGLQEQRFAVGPQDAIFPMLPMRLVSGAIAVSPVAVNEGDAPAYPTWTVTGPGSRLTVTNLRTGESFVWDGLLADAQTATIVTARGGTSIRYDDGTSGYGFLEPGSTLWALPPGSSPLALELLGATGASELRLSYEPRFLSL